MNNWAQTTIMEYFDSDLHDLPLAHEKKHSFQITDSTVWSVLENNQNNLKDGLKMALSSCIPIYEINWLVGFGFNGPLRQYFSLYRAVSQREGEREERIDES